MRKLIAAFYELALGLRITTAYQHHADLLQMQADLYAERAELDAEISEIDRRVAVSRLQLDEIEKRTARPTGALPLPRRNPPPATTRCPGDNSNV